MNKRRRIRQYNEQKKKDQTIQWTKEEGPDNTMDKRRRIRQYNEQNKDGQYNGQKKDRQYNGQKKKDKQ
jgi:hypothetical protein